MCFGTESTKIISRFVLIYIVDVAVCSSDSDLLGKKQYKQRKLEITFYVNCLHWRQFV